MIQFVFQTAQNNERKNGGEGGAGWQIEPDAGEAEGPKEDEEEHGEEEREAGGNKGSLEGLADGDHVALGGKAKPAREIGEAEEGKGAGSQSEELGAGIWHEKAGDGFRNAAHEEHHEHGADGGANEAAALDGTHAAVFSGAPVVADGWLQGITDAVEQRLNESVDKEQDAVNADGHGAAKAHEDGVHEDLCDARGDVVEKVWRAAGGDVAHELPAKTRPCKTQHGFTAQEGNVGDEHTDTHAKAASKRCGPDAPAENAEKNELKSCAEHAHENVQRQATANESADAQEIVHREHGGGERRAEGVDAQVFDSHGSKFAVSAQEANEQRRGSKERGTDENAKGVDEQTGAGEDVVGFFFVTAAKSDGDGHGSADADEIGQRKIDDHKGHGQIDRCESHCADELSHKDAVQGVVKAGSEHTEGAGNGGEEKESHRWCL